jgi:phenylpyruvate tautomerase PptA (4-oxalocrotonate tautomerase family)
MPFYRCLIPKDSLSFEQRRKIAKAFTDVHCGLSAAPRNFVNVVFLEISGGGEIADSHGQGFLTYDTPYFIAGGNRAGRPPELKQQILDGLIEKFSQIAGVPGGQISGHISEAPSSWTMEAGRILPEPGEETSEWYEDGAASG